MTCELQQYSEITSKEFGVCISAVISANITEQQTATAELHCAREPQKSA